MEYVLLYLFWNKKRSEYIQKLSESIRQIEGGYWDADIEVRGKDELGNLAYGLEQMRKNLIKKEENEKKMNKNQNKLVLAMAHDLRTPLTS